MKPVRRLALLAGAVLALATLSTACERTITITEPGKTDTLTVVHVDTVPVLRVDTLLVTHVDTVARTRTDTAIVTRTDTLTRVDTVIRVDTLASPPVHDTTIVVRVDTVTRVDTLMREVHDTTFVPRTDTLLVPSPVVHDTTWIYTQTNPTNPLAGGDPSSGLMVLRVFDTYFVVFWHGHFVGVLQQGNDSFDYTTLVATENWYAYLRAPAGSMIMPLACHKSSWQEAAECLQPLVLTLQPSPARLEPSATLLRAVRVLGGRP